MSARTFPPLVLDVLELRPLKPSDAETLFRTIDQNREHLRQSLGWVDAQVEVSDSRDFISQAEAQSARNEGFQLGIWSADDLAGVIGHIYVDWANRRTEIGYWLAASFQGKSLATMACRALIDHAFDEMRLNRVEIRCAPGNSRSRAIPERLGFQFEGQVRESEWLYDHYEDSVIYGMLAADWPPLRARAVW